MNTAKHISLLSCPVCHDNLLLTGEIVACQNAHTFDFAKEKYLNLLLSHQKKSKTPGDTKEMLVARRVFLEKKYYKELSDAVNSEVNTFLKTLPVQEKVVFDTGSGEGYYTNVLNESVQDPSTLFFGMDIAKEAVRMAAKKYTQILFFVGTIMKRIPLKEKSVHVLLNIFSPRNPAEFARILRPDGLVLIVIPSSGHLSNIRALLGQHAITEQKRERVIEEFETYFTCIGQQEIVFEKVLPKEDLLSLIKMTPIFWQTPQNTWEKIQEVTKLEVNMRFSLLIFKRK